MLNWYHAIGLGQLRCCSLMLTFGMRSLWSESCSFLCNSGSGIRFRAAEKWITLLRLKARAQQYGSSHLREQRGPGMGQEPFLPQSLVQNDSFHLHVCGQDPTHMKQLVTVTDVVKASRGQELWQMCRVEGRGQDGHGLFADQKPNWKALY